MFVRQRINGNYQAVVSKRVNGKIKQEVISLGEYPTVKKSLERALLELRTIDKQLEVPLSEYSIGKLVGGTEIVMVRMKTEQAEKLKSVWLERQRKQMLKIAKLESLVSKYEKNTT